MDYRYKPGDRVVVINDIRECKDYYMRSGSRFPLANVIYVSESTIRTRKALGERLSRFLSIAAIDISSKKRIGKSCGQMICLLVWRTKLSAIVNLCYEVSNGVSI